MTQAWNDVVKELYDSAYKQGVNDSIKTLNNFSTNVVTYITSLDKEEFIDFLCNGISCDKCPSKCEKGVTCYDSLKQWAESK